jgi:hypothetical protein
MKTSIKCSNYVGLVLALCVMVISGCSCSAPKPTPPMPDPLAGFHVSSFDPNKAISDDYQDYIRTLSSGEQRSAGPIFYYEDGTGQHAVEIKVGLSGTVWLHILIYDKDNKRIKTIKHAIGHYAS